MLESIPTAVRNSESIKTTLWKISTATQLSKDYLKDIASKNYLKEVVGYLKSIDIGIGKIPGAASGAIFTAPSLVRVAERVPEIIMPLRDWKVQSERRGPSSPSGRVIVNIKPIVINKRDHYLIEFIQDVLDHEGLHVPLSVVSG
jgi:hypothetical protein